MLKEFKEFAMRGNVVDMAVGIIVGAAFGKIVDSLVADVLMPPIGLVLGSEDFSNLYLVLKEGAVPLVSGMPLAEVRKTGAVTLNYGQFINHVISFLIVAFAVFLLVRTVNRLRRREEAAAPAPASRDCPFCALSIPVKAKRCPHCTSDLEGAGE